LGELSVRQCERLARPDVRRRLNVHPGIQNKATKADANRRAGRKRASGEQDLHHCKNHVQTAFTGRTCRKGITVNPELIHRDLDITP
jgi:hypothetical protein